MITMKIFKILSIIILVQFFSCGSADRVITDDGKVYTINRNNIKQNGIDVSDEIDASQKEKINTLLDRKDEQERAESKQQKELEKAIADQEKVEKEAKEKQRALKSQLDALQESIKNRQNARDDYAKIKTRFEEEQRTFNKLKKSNKLSSLENKEWEAKLKKLELEVKKAKLNLEKF